MLQRTGVTEGAAAEPEQQPLKLANLLNDLDAILDLLSDAVGRRSWLNAFLLAAGANQIVEDWMHGERIRVARGARHIRRTFPRPIGSAVGFAVDAAGSAQARLRQKARLVRWQVALAAVVDRLADAAIHPPEEAERQELLELASRLRDQRSTLPASARRTIVRLPSCFRNFDQHPADLETLTEEFCERWTDVTTPLVVVGVRTSGSYTAPLHAAFLRALGRPVEVVTYRPGQRWPARTLAVLRKVRNTGGMAIVTDDPPKSGGSLARTARELERVGFTRSSIVLLLQTFEEGGLPEKLEAYESVVLPWRSWSVHARLEPDAVGRVLDAFLAPATVTAVRRLPSPQQRRGHTRATYRVSMRRKEDQVEDIEVCVSGVGYGYFGQHSLAVGEALQPFLAETFGYRDGLLYRRWLSEESRVEVAGKGDANRLADAMAEYVIFRSEALRAGDDVSLRLADRGAVWQRAADIVARGFGPAAQFVRPFTYPLAKRLLHTERAAVVDGNMTLPAWFDVDGRVLKVDADRRAFSSLDLYCYDPVFDLAGLTGDLAQRARRHYGARTGRPVSPERWLLYRLVHAAELQRDAAAPRPDVERVFTRETENYYGETIFADADAPLDGPLCAVDLDWTLEGRGLGFPSLTPAGAFALRALARHGYRIVIATGRSLDEVRERCAAFRLSGGVAEYGASVYDRRSGSVRSLLGSDDRGRLERLRDALARLDGVEVDRAYRDAIRAYTIGPKGRRRLGPDLAAQVLTETGVQGIVRAIHGATQTDFMVVGVNKGIALRALTSARGDGDKPLAMAVGDAAEDAPMLALARLAVIPPRAELRSGTPGLRVAARGFAGAVEMLLGHAPGRCPTCATPRLSDDTRALLAVLAALDAHGAGKLAAAARLGFTGRR